MINFDLSQLLIDKRKSVSDLSKLLRTPHKSIGFMVERGTIKPSFLATLETHFGDCSKYIKKRRAA